MPQVRLSHEFVRLFMIAHRLPTAATLSMLAFTAATFTLTKFPQQ